MQKNVKLTPEQQLLVENNLSVVHWVIVNSIHVNPCIYGMSYEDLYQKAVSGYAEQLLPIMLPKLCFQLMQKRWSVTD